MATGWDEELLDRTAGALSQPGRSESSFRTDPSVCPIMPAAGTERKRSD